MNTTQQKPTEKFTNNLFAVAEEGEILSLGKNKSLFIDTTEDSDDGTWLRVSDYVRFANRVNEGDTKAIQNYLVGAKRNKCDWGAFVLEKDSDDGLIVTFDEPIKVHFGDIGGSPVIQEVSRLKGKISYDFFWRRNGGRQDKIANGIELLLEEVEFLS